jgi:integrase
MTVEFRHLTKKNETPDGFPLVVEVSHRGRRLQKKFAFAKLHEYSDAAKMVTPKHPDYDMLVPYMMDLKIRARRLMLKFRDDPKGMMDALFEPVREASDFLLFGRELVRDMEIQAAKFEKRGDLVERNRLLGNAKVYDNVLNQFEKLRVRVTLQDMDGELLERFKSSLLMRGAKPVTVHNYLRTLRAIYNKAVTYHRIHDRKPFAGVFAGLRVRSTQTRKKYLDASDLRKLETYAGGGKRELFVKLFLLQFYFAGCDLIDLYFMKREQLRRGRVYFQRGKTGGPLVDLKVFDKSATLLDIMPQDDVYLISGRKDKTGYENFRSHYYRALGEVQKELSVEVLPLGGRLGSKVARHTFQNRAKVLGVDADLIRELVGHERDDVDQYYKDRYPEGIRDAAHWMVINIEPLV